MYCCATSNLCSYGDNENAWAPGAKDTGAESISVSFPKFVCASNVLVYESYNGG